MNTDDVSQPAESDAPSCWRGCPVEVATGLQRHQYPCDLSGTTTRITPPAKGDDR
jgi:hypothetical protein